jgi:copper chaperone CopZ
MTCKNCVRHIQEAIAKIKDVASVEVNLALRKAFVESEIDIDDSAFVNAVSDAGYDVVEIKNQLE